MNKRKFVSIVLVIVLCITLFTGIKFNMFGRMFEEKREDHKIQETSGSIGQGEAGNRSADIQNNKELDAKYIQTMNENVYCKSFDGTELNVNVLDAKLTRDISSYRASLSNYYLNGDAPSYADENGVFKSEYYYMVVRVKITNVGNHTGEVLVPGTFRYWFMTGKNTTFSDMNGEISFAGKVEGKSSADMRGHLVLQAGESSVYDVISVIDETHMNQEIALGKQCYLVTNESSIKMIPNDDDRVRFIKLDFRIEE